MLAEIKIQKSTHNGRLGIVIRKARESDVHLIDEMHDRISKDSMYFRYLGVKKPGLEELHRLCSNENGMVLVATTDTDNQEKIIGIACYTLYRSDSTSAEPAVLVEDSYQGLGLGKRIVADLIRRAIQNGVTTFISFIHPINQRVLHMIQRSGMHSEIKYVDGLKRVRVRLDQIGKI